MSQNGLSFTLRFVFGLAAFGLVLAFMNLASEFIVQILLAWIIVLSASPLFYWLRLRKVSGWLALVITLIAIVVVFGFLVVISIFACLIGALVVVPALCIVIKPAFLDPK